MASRRDWLLQQLEITQWAVRRPAVLQGEIAVRVPPEVRLLVIAHPLPESDEPLLHDVLQTLRLQSHQVYCVTPQQVAMLPAQIPCNSWCLGEPVESTVLGAQLQSPTLSDLYHSATAKRALWQQICHHEHHFYPDV